MSSTNDPDVVGVIAEMVEAYWEEYGKPKGIYTEELAQSVVGALEGAGYRIVDVSKTGTPATV